MGFVVAINYTCIEKQDPGAQRGKELTRASQQELGVKSCCLEENTSLLVSAAPFTPSSQQALLDFPGGSVMKNLPANSGATGAISDQEDPACLVTNPLHSY